MFEAVTPARRKRSGMRYIDQRIIDNRAVFPDARSHQHLEMLRVQNRIRTKIELR